MLENEEFQRLPLPKDYDLQKEILENLKIYPDQEEMSKNISIFRNQERPVDKVNYLA